jgi:tetratricopeptide (TPR) repeat protein
MNLKTIIYFLLFFLIIGLFVTWASYNQQSLTVDFFFKEVTSSAWVILLITFLIGFLICLIFMLIHNSQLKIRQWNKKKELKKKEEAENYYREGIALLLKGNQKNALEKFNQAIQLNEQYIDAYVKAGDILREMKKYEEAIQLHISARQISSSNLEVLISLAEDYKTLKNYERAEEILHEAIALQKEENLSLLRNLRELFFLQKKWDEAEMLQMKIIKLSRKSSEIETEQEMLYGIKYQLGLAELDKGEIREAISIFRHLIREKPDFSPAYESLGQIYLKENKAEKAEEIWFEGYETSGYYFLLQKIEELYIKQDNPQGAIDTYKRVLKTEKDDLYLRFLLGKLYYRLEMIDQAFEEFQTIEGQIVESSPIINYFIAKSLQKRDECKEAYESLLKVLEDKEKILEIGYVCTHCNKMESQWAARCPNCGNWNTLRLNLGHQLDKLKVQPPSFIPTID